MRVFEVVQLFKDIFYVELFETRRIDQLTLTKKVFEQPFLLSLGAFVWLSFKNEAAFELTTALTTFPNQSKQFPLSVPAVVLARICDRFNCFFLPSNLLRR